MRKIEGLTKEFLIEEYVNNRLSTKKIAIKIKCSSSTILSALKRCDILVRDKSESHKGLKQSNKTRLRRSLSNRGQKRSSEFCKLIQKFNPKTGKFFSCETCGKKRYFQLYQINNNRHYFCSIECSKKFYKSLKVQLQCKNCNNYFFREKWKINDQIKNVFCSPKCQQEYQRGENHYLFGVKSPQTSKRMIENNPTKRQDVRNKISKGVSEFYKNGNIHHLKDKHLSLESRLKMSKAKGGNGIVLVDKKYSREFTVILKKKIRERDNYVCQGHGMTEEEHLIVYGLNLDIHHIDYNKQNCKETNLIALCKQCNTRANFNRDYWKRFYQEKINRIYEGVV